MRLDDLRRDALRGESQRLALAGASAEAIGLAATLLQLDPLDENAHQTVVRLQLQRGDVRSARLQFEACRALLDRELGVDPLPETTELGDAIAAAERAIRQHTPLATIGAIPPALLRPRVLVGRSAELAAVSRAWSEGRIVLLVEVAGAGTRQLALDAADRHGHAAIALDALITLARQARTAGAYARSAALLDDAAHRAGHPTSVKITIDRHWVTFHLAWARGGSPGSIAPVSTPAPAHTSITWPDSLRGRSGGRRRRSSSCARR